ncbi:TrbI F-type domain-containing protein [Acidovorax delafieldii]|uniref:TrbI F-type domain-containing protein n=1 Tax=Acidovorax delafieldii TaxID=47920 RepID=UPI003ECD9CCC
MTTETTPVPVAIDVTQKRSPGGIVALAFDVLVIVAVSLLTMILAIRFVPAIGLSLVGSKSDGQFLVANIESLAREEMLALGDMVRKGEILPAEMPAKTEKFSDELIKVLQAYADETGKVVLRKDSVVAAPESVVDLTDEIRSKLLKSGAMQHSHEPKDKP